MAKRGPLSPCKTCDLDATLFYHMKRPPPAIFPLHQRELEDQGPDELHSFNWASRAQCEVQRGSFSVDSREKNISEDGRLPYIGENRES
jgi:hypothetical protein